MSDKKIMTEDAEARTIAAINEICIAATSKLRELGATFVLTLDYKGMVLRMSCGTLVQRVGLIEFERAISRADIIVAHRTEREKEEEQADSQNK